MKTPFENLLFAPIALVICLGLSGCSTGVVAAGPDTYMISKSIPFFSTVGSAKASIYRDASKWCAERGLIMVPVASDATQPVAGQHMGSAELTFRGLRPGDPEVRRTNIERPDYTHRIQSR
jgi:hypothetical protein